MQCTGTEMTVTVKPHGTFGGKMYPLGFLGDSTCELTEQTSGSGVYSQTFSYTDCGIVETAVVSSASTALHFSIVSLCPSVCVCVCVCVCV